MIAFALSMLEETDTYMKLSSIYQKYSKDGSGLPSIDVTRVSLPCSNEFCNENCEELKAMLKVHHAVNPGMLLPPVSFEMLYPHTHPRTIASL